MDYEEEDGGTIPCANCGEDAEMRVDEDQNITLIVCGSCDYVEDRS